MPPEQARLIASAAYTLARAANADLDISDDETAAIERELQAHEATRRGDRRPRDRDGQAPGQDRRWHRGLRRDPRVQGASPTIAQRLARPRACFAVMAANGSISAEETADVNEIADELDIDEEELQRHPRRYHEKFSSVQQIRRVSGRRTSPHSTDDRAMREAVRGAARSLRAAIANPAIRRVEAAYTGGIAGDWVLLVALLVVAYQAGGPLASASSGSCGWCPRR